jgi:hypothetical protein
VAAVISIAGDVVAARWSIFDSDTVVTRILSLVLVGLRELDHISCVELRKRRQVLKHFCKFCNIAAILQVLYVSLRAPMADAGRGCGWLW